MTNPVRKTGAVPATVPVRTRAKSSSFQLKMKQISAAEAMPGMTTGAMTLRIVVIMPAPSTWAASSISMRDLREEGAQHPDRDRQVHHRVEEDEQPDVVEQVDLLGEQVDRQQPRDDRQELGRQEEEQHVRPLLDRTDRQGVGRGEREHDDEDRRADARGRRVDQRRPRPGGQERLVAVEAERGEERRRVGRGVGSPCGRRSAASTGRGRRRRGRSPRRRPRGGGRPAGSCGG